MKSAGIHHVTAIAGDAVQNVRFYTKSLGSRLVKRTVNFDDPSTYHLYYGDSAGRPGSILTFFPFAGASPGREGAGSVVETALSVPDDTLDAWLDTFARLKGASASGAFDFAAITERMGERVLPVRDPDGLALSLVGKQDAPPAGTLDGVTLLVADPEPTTRVLTDVLGFTLDLEENGRLRLVADPAQPGHRIDLLAGRDLGRRGAGTIHHIAFRARDEAEQLEWQERVSAAGLAVTEVKDRQYFKSIYFREPGGVLFEIATDPPGFALDEPLDALGESLMLPPWLEARRSLIEARLPPLR